MQLFSKAAVFVGGQRQFRDVPVEMNDGKIIVKNSVTGEVLTSYTIEETAKVGMAWDVYLDSNPDNLFRLVVQEGCGCGGQRPYEFDTSYSGKIKF